VDGADETYRLTGRAAGDAGKDITTGTEKSTKVTVCYPEDAGQKGAHCFKKAV